MFKQIRLAVLGTAFLLMGPLFLFTSCDELPFDLPVSESEIAEGLREALKVLTAEGLVRHEPRRGCFVNQITERDLDEIFPVIALLEGRCAFEAASNATDADLVTLEQMHDRLNRCAKNRRINDYYQANFGPYQFDHARIIEFPGYQTFAQAFAGTMPYSESIGFAAEMIFDGFPSSFVCLHINRKRL